MFSRKIETPAVCAPRWHAVLFLAAAAVTLTPWVGPPMALAMGLVLGLGGVHPFARGGWRN